MRNPLTLLALSLAALALGACNPSPPDPPLPVVAPVKVDPVVSPSAATDPSVPSADSVMVPASETPKSDASVGRTNSSMTATQESTAMPMAGQNNDHSAPVTPAKRASAP